MATASTRTDVHVPVAAQTPLSQSDPSAHAQPPSWPIVADSAQSGAPSKIVAEMVT